MILLVVDTQMGITNASLYDFENFVSNVCQLLKKARENHVEVVYVRHDDGKGELLTKGNPEFEIYHEFQPIKEEKIFDKVVNSPFKESGLLEYLTSKNVQHIMVVGLQSEYCIDATIKCGFEHGFTMLVVQHANTTVDNDVLRGEQSYHYYNDIIWKDRYAKSMTMEEAIRCLNDEGNK